MSTNAKTAKSAAAYEAKPVEDGKTGLPSEEEVVAHLRYNPEFFLKHEDLLAELLLPHESGAAVSLLERQVTVLRKRGMETTSKLGKLLENARNNDQIFEATKTLILSLLRARDITEIVSVTVDQLCGFSSIDACELILVEQPELRVSSSIRTMPLADLEQHYPDVFRLKRTHCGTLDQQQLVHVFPTTDQIRSTALCPVYSEGEVLALIALGNHADANFNVNQDTLFVDFIGMVVGAVLHRQLEI